MPIDVEAAYHQALAGLGAGRRWYQSAGDLHYAAIAAAAGGIEGTAVRAVGDELAASLGITDPLRSIIYTVTAVGGLRGVDLGSFTERRDAVAELLRPAIRSTKKRRITAGIMVACSDGDPTARAPAVADLYEAWHQRHRILTTSDDLALAAVIDAAGVDHAAVLERSAYALERLATEGYPAEWDIARTLSLNPPASSMERFLWLANELRGRRRRPLSDRRLAIALLALSTHQLMGLPDLVTERIERMRVGRFRPEAAPAFEQAALLTLGESTSAGNSASGAFHGFLLLLHHRRAQSDNASG